MRQDNYCRLLGQIQSLTDSTDLRISCRHTRVSAKLSGRCSPYITHKSVEFDELLNSTDGIITLQNDRFTVIWEAAEGGQGRTILQDGLVCEVIQGYVPCKMLASLQEELAMVGYELPHPYEGVGMIRFYVPVLESYDNDGKPIYIIAPESDEPDPKAEIEDECYLSDETLEEMQSES